MTNRENTLMNSKGVIGPGDQCKPLISYEMEVSLRTWTTDDSGVLGQCRWETEPSAVSPGIDHDDIRKSGFEMASLHPGRAV